MTIDLKYAVVCLPVASQWFDLNLKFGFSTEASSDARSCYVCCPSCMDTCLCFLFHWLFTFCLQFTVALCWSDRGPVLLCDWIFWGLEFLENPLLDISALPKTVLSPCFFLVQHALSFEVAHTILYLTHSFFFRLCTSTPPHTCTASTTCVQPLQVLKNHCRIPP